MYMNKKRQIPFMEQPVAPKLYEGSKEERAMSRIFIKF